MGIAEVTYGLMAQKVIITVGKLDGADVDSYLTITAKGGTCVLTAIGSLVDAGDAEPRDVDPAAKNIQ